MLESKLFSALNNLGYPVYPLKLPQGINFPAITYLVVNEDKKQEINCNVFGVVKRFQVDVWSKSYKESKLIAKDVVDILIELKAYEISLQDLFEEDIEIYRILIEFKLKE